VLCQLVEGAARISDIIAENDKFVENLQRLSRQDLESLDLLHQELERKHDQEMKNLACAKEQAQKNLMEEQVLRCEAEKSLQQAEAERDRLRNHLSSLESENVLLADKGVLTGPITRRLIDFRKSCCIRIAGWAGFLSALVNNTNIYLRQVHLDNALATLDKSLVDKALKKVCLEEPSSDPYLCWKSEKSVFLEELGRLGVTLDLNILSEAQTAAKNIIAEVQKVSSFKADHGLYTGYLRGLEERLAEVVPANCSSKEYINVLRSIAEGKPETADFRDAILKRLGELPKCSNSRV